jgi:large conductance mechanosensitive channel
MKSTTKEFREFLLKQNAFALAIGVVIGAAIGKVVSGIVEDVLMPIIGLALPGGEWRNAQLTLSGQNAIKYGDLAGRIIDFLFIAIVVFLLAKAFLEKPAAAPATKSCPQCLELIPAAARKCRACGSQVA